MTGLPCAPILEVSVSVLIPLLLTSAMAASISFTCSIQKQTNNNPTFHHLKNEHTIFDTVFGC